jgi:hypothetical protein
LEKECRCLEEKGEQITLSIFMVNHTLQEVNNNFKTKRRKRISLSNSTLAPKIFSSSPIDLFVTPDSWDLAHAMTFLPPLSL